MKKNYEKPEIAFDSFELSQSIAGDCVAISNQDEGTCAVMIGGLSLLNTNMCMITPPPGDNKICYDVPSDTMKVFVS